MEKIKTVYVYLSLTIEIIGFICLTKHMIKFKVNLF